MTEQNLRFDVMCLLKAENYNSKPNMGKFLKKYVKDIYLTLSPGKIQMWPKITYLTAKCLIKFLDGHELIKDYNIYKDSVYMFKDLDEIELQQDEMNIIRKFFSYLESFKFIRINQQSVEQMISKDGGIENLNKKLDEENKIIENHILSGDFTPHITVN